MKNKKNRSKKGKPTSKKQGGRPAPLPPSSNGKNGAGFQGDDSMLAYISTGTVVIVAFLFVLVLINMVNYATGLL